MVEFMKWFSAMAYCSHICTDMPMVVVTFAP